MHTRTRLLFTTFLAVLLLLTVIATTSANRLSLSNRNFTAKWTAVTLGNPNLTPIKCPLTMEGSFHSQTMSKVEEALIGHISRATFANGSCTSGHATVLQEHLPWHIRYGGFEGTLPNISGVTLRLVGVVFRVESSSGLKCITETTAAHPFKEIAIIGTGPQRGRITGLRADETAEIPAKGGFLCEIGGEWTFSGTGEVTLLGATTVIILTLI